MAQLVAPEIPGLYNPALTLLAGYSAVASINNHRRQSDIALRELALHEKTAEWQHDKQAQALDQAGERISNLNEHYQRADEINSLNQARKDQLANDTMRQAKTDTQRLIDMQGKLYSNPHKIGTTPYLKYADEVKTEFSDITGSAEAKRILTPLETRYWKSRHEAETSFTNQLSSYNINPWKASTVFTAPKELQLKDAPDGDMQFSMGIDKAGKPIVAKIPKKKYDELKPLYHDFNDYGSAKVLNMDDVQSNAARAREVIKQGGNEEGVKVRFKQKFGVDLDSVE